jgi:hypothetical protein
MMWHLVLPAWVEMLKADLELSAELGGPHIYVAQSARPVRVPSVEYTLPIIDREEELFNAITVQVDYWARGAPKAAAIEGHIRRLTHRDTARVLGGFRMWTLYQDSRSHQYPAELGVVHRSMDFLFRPLRAKYLEMHETS